MDLSCEKQLWGINNLVYAEHQNTSRGRASSRTGDFQGNQKVESSWPFAGETVCAFDAALHEEGPRLLNCFMVCFSQSRW